MTSQFPTHVYDDGNGEVMYVNLGPGVDENLVVALPENFWVDATRDRIWSLLKLEREKALDAGTTTPYGVVQTNKVSRDAIDSLYLAATADPEWLDNFILANNTTVPVDLEKITVIKLAVAQHVSTVMARVTEIRSQLDAATTVEEVEAVDLTVA